MSELEWLSRHPEEEAKYRGEYIAIVGEKIVAHGKDPKTIIEEAKKISHRPLIAKVPLREGLMIV
ncbi:MAG: DUF5678 domain-containing protein [Nitrospirota bacterium]